MKSKPLYTVNSEEQDGFTSSDYTDTTSEVAVKPVIVKNTQKNTEVSINPNFDDEKYEEEKHDVIDLIDSSQHSLSLRESVKPNGDVQITESHRGS